MNKRGFARPGALQMLIAVFIPLIGSIAPIMYAVSTPGHEWSYYLSGFPAFLVSISGVLVFALYAIGFVRYCASKGYSKWLGVLLLFGNIFGFIVLLLLPDRNITTVGDVSSAPREPSNR